MVRLCRDKCYESQRDSGDKYFYVCSLNEILSNLMPYDSIKGSINYDKFSLSTSENAYISASKDIQKHRIDNSTVIFQFMTDSESLDKRFHRHVKKVFIYINFHKLNQLMMNSLHYDTSYITVLAQKLNKAKDYIKRYEDVRIIRLNDGAETLATTYLSTMKTFNDFTILWNRWKSFVYRIIPFITSISGQIKELSNNVKFYDSEIETDRAYMARNIIGYIKKTIRELPFTCYMLLQKEDEDYIKYIIETGGNISKKEEEDNMYELFLLMMKNERYDRINFVRVNGLSIILSTEESKHIFTLYPSNHI